MNITGASWNADRRANCAVARCELAGVASLLTEADDARVGSALAETVMLALPGSAARWLGRSTVVRELLLWRSVMRECTFVPGDALTAGTSCAGTLSVLTASEVLDGAVMWELGGRLERIEIGPLSGLLTA